VPDLAVQAGVVPPGVMSVQVVELPPAQYWQRLQSTGAQTDVAPAESPYEQRSLAHVASPPVAPVQGWPFDFLHMPVPMKLPQAWWVSSQRQWPDAQSAALPQVVRQVCADMSQAKPCGQVLDASQPHAPDASNVGLLGS